MDTHLHHAEEHLSSSAFISDILMGVSDDLTVPFPLAAGLSGAVAAGAAFWVAKLFGA